MRKLRRTTCLLQALLVLATTGFAKAQELAASLEAEITFQSTDGTELKQAQAGESFVISAKLRDVVTGAAYVPKDDLQAWIRRVEKSNIPCRQAARNYRAAEGRLPIGALDLNGMLIASLTREGNLHIVSPKLDLAQANIIFSASLKNKSPAMLYHGETRTLYVSQSESGEILRVRPFENRLSVFAKSLSSPTLMASGEAGSLWVHEKGKQQITQFSADGELQKSLAVKANVDALQATGAYILAHQKRGDMSLFHAPSNTNLKTFDSRKNIAAADLFSGPNGAYSAFVENDKAVLSLVYLDNPEAILSVPLSAAPTELAFSPDGKWIIAYDHKKPAISIVEVATATMISGLSFGTGVQELAFVEGNVFFRLSNNKGIASLRLDSLTLGKEPAVALSDFGIQQGIPVDGERLLLPLRGGYLVAVQSGSEAGFVVNAKMQLSRSLPQTGIRFRGGLPLRIEALENGFQAKPDGSLQTSAVLSKSGEHELVLSTGIQGLTTCLKFDVKALGQEEEENAFRLIHLNPQQKLRKGVETEFRFEMQSKGRTLQLNAPPKFKIVHLQAGWRKILQSRVENSVAVFNVSLPIVGVYDVQLLGLPAGWRLDTVQQMVVEP